MNIPEAMQKAVGGFRWPEVRAHLEGYPAEEFIPKTEAFLDVILRDGYLIVRRPDTGKLARREEFLRQFRAFAAERGAGGLFEARASRLAAILLTEGAYQGILATLNEQVLAKTSAPELVWATARWCDDQARELEGALRAPAGTPGQVFDPVGGKIHVESAGDVNPDQLLYKAMRVLTSTVKMLAYDLKWFADDGAIVVPEAVLTGGEMAGLVSLNACLASAWTQVERSEGRCRHFGGSVTETEAEHPENAECLLRTVHFDFANCREVEMHVAGERLKWMFLKFNEGLAEAAGLRDRMSLPAPVPLAPEGLVSHLEAHAAVALSNVLFKWVGEIEREYAELTIVEWLRGYSLLQVLGKAHLTKGPENCIGLFTERFLKEVLGRGSLPPEKAARFIRNVTLGRDADDVFDAPLLRCADGTFYLVSAAAANLHPFYVIMSRLASLRCDLAWKGKTLEGDIVSLFRSNGVPAASMKRKIDGSECEVDCIVVWGGILFVFECKNHSLPRDNPQAELWFLHEQADAARQAKVKAAILDRHREVVAELLGVRTDWVAVMPVVLNGMPFSLPGPIDGVYFYDSSALHRFFKDGQISVRVGDEVLDGPVKLWAGDRPDAMDLLRQLKDPAQAAMVGRRFYREEMWFAVSAGLAIKTAQVVRGPHEAEARGEEEARE